MEVTFHLEEWQACKDEMAYIWPIHWEEIAGNKDKIALNMWLEAYDNLAAINQLKIVTVRNKENTIVGYHWSIVRPHLHYQQSLTAYTDMFFILPEYRKGGNGTNMFKFVEQVWRDLGVQKAYTTHKIKHDIGKIFERLGWTRSEVVFVKMLED